MRVSALPAACAKAGSAFLATHREPSVSASISISDTGPGIAAADQRVIFEPFRQVDASTSREHEGTGHSTGRGLVGMPMHAEHGHSIHEVKPRSSSRDRIRQSFAAGHSVDLTLGGRLSRTPYVPSGGAILFGGR